MLRAAALALGLLLILPLAVAREPVRADVSVEQPWVVDGSLRVTDATTALFDLTPDVARGAQPVLTWASAEGHAVEYETDYLRPAGVQVVGDGAPQRTAYAWGPGELRDLVCLDDCEIFAYVRDAGARTEYAANASTELAPLEEAAWYGFGTRDETWSETMQVRAPPGWIALEALPGASGAIEGDFVFFLYGARATFAEQRVHVIETGTQREQTSRYGPLGEREVATFVALHLYGATLRLAPGSTARYLAADPVVHVEGSLATERATGSVSFGGRTFPLDHAPLAMEGAVSFLWSPPAHAALFEAAPATLIQGEADSIVAGGDFLGTLLPDADGRASTALGLLALAALLFSLARVAPLSFAYVRLARADVLAHPVRARMFDAISANPGLGHAALVSAVGKHRSVVAHHLWMLESHGYVVVRRESRRVGIFPQGVSTAGWRASAGRTRLEVQETVRAHPNGLTADDVARALGISRRLAAYHLGCLHREGALEREGRRGSLYRMAMARKPQAAEA